MKIAHFAPFAPYRCGLYEAARDWAHADALRGHQIVFCDTGTTVTLGKPREFAQPHTIDDRGGWKLQLSDWTDALDADIWVCHDGINDNIAVRSLAPMIWAIHVRPLAAFRPEQANQEGRPYSIVQELATWPRVKKLVTMWREFVPHWAVMVPPEKLVCTDAPPIDRQRYSPDGPTWALPPDKVGKFNILIADTWRDDVDIYEVSVACLAAAKQRAGVKIHFWAVEPACQKPWQHVWRAMDQAGCLGVINERTERITDLYRAVDLLVSPHLIAVRTIGEALACGLPVVAAEGNQFAPFTGRVGDAADMAEAIGQAVDQIAEDRAGSRMKAREASAPFDLAAFGERIEAIYREVSNG